MRNDYNDFDNQIDEELRLMVGKGEKVLYSGKPDKKCFIYESVFNPLLPFAALWAVIDFGFIWGITHAEGERHLAYFAVPFFLLHLMPVWLYLGGVLLTLRRDKNTSYIITEKAIYASEGTFSKQYKTKPFTELSHVDLHRGIFDQWLGVGDVVTASAQAAPGPNGKAQNADITLEDLPDYLEVYGLVKKLQEGVCADAIHPHEPRPPENHGYRAKYRG